MPVLIFVLLCAEIAILIKLGQVGGGTVVLIEMLVSGILGYVALRTAGRKLVRSDMLIGLLLRPTTHIRRPGWLPIIGGLLLIVPGVLSDVLGLVLIVRHWLAPSSQPTEQPSAPPSGSEAIDVEFEVKDEDRT